MTVNESIDLSIIVTPYGNASELQRLLTSISEQCTTISIEVLIPEEWFEEKPDAEKVLIPYDGNLASYDAGAVIERAHGRLVLFCSPTSILPNNIAYEVMNMTACNKIIQVEVRIITGGIALPMKNRDASIYGLLAPKTLLSEVLSAHGKLSVYGFGIVLNAVTNDVTILSNCQIYDTDEMQGFIHKPPREKDLFDYVAHLSPASQIAYASQVVGNALDYPLGALLDVEQKMMTHTAIRFGLCQRYLNAWWSLAVENEDEKAFECVKAYLQQHEHDKTVFAATLQCLGLAQSVYPLLQSSSHTEFCYLMNKVENFSITTQVRAANRLQEDTEESLPPGSSSMQSRADTDIAVADKKTSTSNSSSVQSELKRLRNENAQLQHKYNRISKSYSYKIGHAMLVGPYQIVKRVRKHKRKKQNL